MDQNFQTSFIPKKPMVEERVRAPRPVGFLFIVSLLILFTVLIASGGLYFYKKSVEGNISQMEKDLALAQNRFEPAKITQLQTLDKRLKASSEILDNHIAISPVFKTLQDVTMKTVRYTEFSYDLSDDKNTKVLVKMKGQAVGYKSIALQSDLFTKKKELIDPVFSNLNLDNNGNVVFDLEFSVDPLLVDYKEVQKKEGSVSLLEND